ncbi:uncharacterized protein LOC119734951 [Patiria miniata]|uniref:Uncharacterized protein n=1 Tax=Patiria miniata TaxID=46514 RepID=A0A913ZAU8_PATMI|nr:uncharacterized protein LOC119722174 [Patiria miniata]XP_038064526.1 uncharacterized protein LOC119734951 [Patiria miniata]
MVLINCSFSVRSECWFSAKQFANGCEFQNGLSMTFGMYCKTTPVFMSTKTNDKTAEGRVEDAYLSGEVAMKKMNSAPLPRIRVEECGLTVDMRKRRDGRSKQSKGKDRLDSKISKFRGGASSESNPDEIPAGSLRERWLADARDSSTGQAAVVERSFSTEFVDSLRIGKADSQALTRGQALPGPMEPRPIPRMRYSKGAPLISRSIGDAVDTFQTRRAASMGAVSSKERVVIRRLAAKRSETIANQDLFLSTTDRTRRYNERNERLQQRASWRDRRYHSLEDTRSRLGMVTRKYKRGGSTCPEDFDFQLTYTNADDMARELRSRSGADLFAGDLTDKARRGTPGERGGSSGTSDESSVVHSVDCPMCYLYEPSRFGHVCPPNTPLIQLDKKDEML